jgi:hypothetical protein
MVQHVENVAAPRTMNTNYEYELCDRCFVKRILTIAYTFFAVIIIVIVAVL